MFAVNELTCTVVVINKNTSQVLQVMPMICTLASAGA